jgi:hypothetical protein
MSKIDSVMGSSMLEDEGDNDESVEVQSSDIQTCEDCEELGDQLFYCSLCKILLCEDCWNAWVKHKKKRKDAALHEKTDPKLAQKIQAVFANDVELELFEQLHEEDQNTAWFGKKAFQSYVVQAKQLSRCRKKRD